MDSRERKFCARFVAMSTLLRERSVLCGAKCVSDVTKRIIESDEDLEEISVVRVQALKGKAVISN